MANRATRLRAAAERLTKPIDLGYVPQARQLLLHSTAVRQIFYGGAAMGGKSYSLLWGEGISRCITCPGLQVYLFRRKYPELEDNHIKYLRMLPTELGRYHETHKRFEFFNGSMLHTCACEEEKDIKQYQGRNMHVVLIDEATQMTPMQIGYILGWNRIGNYVPPPELKHVFPRAVLASNPGGVSHNYLKRKFKIGTHPPEKVFYDEAMKNKNDPSDLGWKTIFIPAFMKDNRYADENYAASFGGLPEELQKAYVDGDWDAIVGAALRDLSKDRHMTRPFTPPRWWTHFMTMDWGTARPFSIGWWVVVGSDSDGAVLKARDGWAEKFLPNGAIVRFREWYGWSGKENEGTRLDSESVARRILEIEKDNGLPAMDFRVADSQMWAQSDGSTPAEKMINLGVVISPSKKDRKIGYSEVLSRLAGNPILHKSGTPGEYPMMYATSDCVHFWRTLPSLVLDETEPDKGPDTKQEDHVYDEVVYGCRRRPYMTTERDRWEDEVAEAERGFALADPYATAS